MRESLPFQRCSAGNSSEVRCTVEPACTVSSACLALPVNWNLVFIIVQVDRRKIKTITMEFALFDDADFDLSELDLQDFECAIVTDSSSGTVLVQHRSVHCDV